MGTGRDARADIQMSPLGDPGRTFQRSRADISEIQGGHPERQGGHSCVPLTVKEPSLNPPNRQLASTAADGDGGEGETGATERPTDYTDQWLEIRRGLKSEPT
jgi:hypothetical protein